MCERASQVMWRLRVGNFKLVVCFFGIRMNRLKLSFYIKLNGERIIIVRDSGFLTISFLTSTISRRKLSSLPPTETGSPQREASLRAMQRWFPHTSAPVDAPGSGGSASAVSRQPMDYLDPRMHNLCYINRTTSIITELHVFSEPSTCWVITSTAF